MAATVAFRVGHRDPAVATAAIRNVACRIDERPICGVDLLHIARTWNDVDAVVDYVDHGNRAAVVTGK